jgi:hypothetical protein
MISGINSLSSVLNISSNVLDIIGNSRNKKCIDIYDKNVPDISGTWSQNYKILRIEKYENLPSKIDADYINSFFEENRYTLAERTFGKFSDIKDIEKPRVLIKQDPKDARYCIVYEDALEKAIRPVTGIRPGHIRRIDSCIWELINPDYDDNGIFSLKFKVDKNGKVNKMIGHYFEAGYGTLGLVQAPTCGIIVYEKLDDEIKTTDQFKTPDNVRKIKNRFVPPEQRRYLNVLPQSDGLCSKELLDAEKSVLPRNAKSKSESSPPSEWIFNRNLLTRENMTNSEVKELSEIRDFTANSGLTRDGPIFTTNGEFLIGFINQKALYLQANGKSIANIESDQVFLPKENWVSMKDFNPFQKITQRVDKAKENPLYGISSLEEFYEKTDKTDKTEIKTRKPASRVKDRIESVCARTAACTQLSQPTIASLMSEQNTGDLAAAPDASLMVVA